MEIRHSAIVVAIFSLMLLSGCKAKQVIHERTITSVDSTAIIYLQRQLSEKEATIERLKIDLNRTRDEFSRLQSEVSSHTINYDTTASVNPETGKYPIASETITQTRQQLDRTIKELETVKSEHNKEITAERSKSSNLQQEVTQLRDENRELKSETTATAGSGIMSIVYGFIIGVVLTTIFFLKKKIKLLI